MNLRVLNFHSRIYCGTLFYDTFYYIIFIIKLLYLLKKWFFIFFIFYDLILMKLDLVVSELS